MLTRRSLDGIWGETKGINMDTIDVAQVLVQLVQYF